MKTNKDPLLYITMLMVVIYSSDTMTKDEPKENSNVNGLGSTIKMELKGSEINISIIPIMSKKAKRPQLARYPILFFRLFLTWVAKYYASSS